MRYARKSRGGVRGFATYKDPSVFAAASDVDNTSFIDLLAVKRGHSIMCFGAVAAFGQAPETELIFIEAPAEHRAKGAIAMPESERRQTERSESVAGSLRGHTTVEGVSRNLQAESEVPDDLLLERVRDCIGPACGRRDQQKKMMEVFAYLEAKTVSKLSPIFEVGSSFEHVASLKFIDEEGTWVKELDKYRIPFSRLLTVVAMSFLFAIFAFVLQLRLQRLGI